MVVAGDVASATGASTHMSGGFDHGADHFRVLTHAKVVVRAPDHDRARAVRRMPQCVREAPGDALEICKHAVAPFLVQPGKRGGKEMIIDHWITSLHRFDGDETQSYPMSPRTLPRN